MQKRVILRAEKAQGDNYRWFPWHYGVAADGGPLVRMAEGPTRTGLFNPWQDFDDLEDRVHLVPEDAKYTRIGTVQGPYLHRRKIH